MDHPPAKSTSGLSLPQVEVPRLQATLFSAYEALYFQGRVALDTVAPQTF
jgi:hypothetical protein